jgi:hypothetical protein
MAAQPNAERLLQDPTHLLTWDELCNDPRFQDLPYNAQARACSKWPTVGAYQLSSAVAIALVNKSTMVVRNFISRFLLRIINMVLAERSTNLVELTHL